MPNHRSRQERHDAKIRNKAKGKKKGHIIKKISAVLCILIGLGIVCGGIAVGVTIHRAPPLNPAKLNTPMATQFYDKNDKMIHTVFNQHSSIKVNIKNVPPLMKKAVISVEDRHFYHQFGIAPIRIIEATFTDLLKGRLAQGASTIDQQVIKRDFLSSKKTFIRKIQGAWLAIQLDRHYTKDQILQMYLNQVYYGEGAYGIGRASEVYFGTNNLAKLNLSQMALLAGLPNLPSADDPYTHPKNAEKRRDVVLKAMVKNGVITKQQEEKAASKPIKSLLVPPKQRNQQSSNYSGAFVNIVYNELVKQRHIISSKQFQNGGLKIYLTMDPDAQKEVYNLQHSNVLGYPDNYFNSAITVTDTPTGAIRAVGGGRHFTNYLSGVNYATAKSDIGSTAKPFADYGPAIEYLKWPTSHEVNDNPYHWPASLGGGSLHDWDNKYQGKMTIRKALYESRNIPAAKTMLKVGKNKATSFASKLGIMVKNPVPGTFAIGSYKPGASPLQMAGAYAAFGNQGVYHKPYAVRKIVFPDGKTMTFNHKSVHAMHKYTAYMITDMLKSVIQNPRGTAHHILGQSLPSKIPVAGKSGSVGLNKKYHATYDRPLREEWFVGYTPQYSISVWTGYSKVMHHGKPYYVKGGQHSAGIAQETFLKVINHISGKNVPDWKMPNSVVSVPIEKNTGKRASKYTPKSDIINALFVKGTKPTHVSTKYLKLNTPSNLQAKYNNKQKNITLTWNDPKGKNIEFKVSDSINGQNMQTLGTTKTKSLVVNNPKPGSTYQFEVTAVKGNKKSSTAKTSVVVPSAKLIPPSGVNAIYDKQNNRIVVKWNDPQNQNQNVDFQVAYSVDGSPMKTVGTTSHMQAVINQPKPGSTYTIQIVAQQGNQQSGPAKTSVNVTNVKLVPPSGVNAMYDKQNNRIVVKWNDPQDQNQNVDFQVTYSVDGSPMKTIGTTSHMQAVINQPKSGSTYTIQIVAQHGNQQSDPAKTRVNVP